MFMNIYFLLFITETRRKNTDLRSLLDLNESDRFQVIEISEDIGMT